MSTLTQPNPQLQPEPLPDLPEPGRRRRRTRAALAPDSDSRGITSAFDRRQPVVGLIRRAVHFGVLLFLVAAALG
ncbi:MAG: hypothetical protein JWO11_1844, partial [Nocardioides sp.]|nr:hypothetical protein [Nocardioides sp.]